MELESVTRNIELSAGNLGRWIAFFECEFSTPEGIVTQLLAMVKKLEEIKITNAIKIGGYAFKDINSILAWFSTVSKDVLRNFCINMISLSILTQDTFVDIASGMQAYATVLKAMFKDLHWSLVLSHDIT